jgi:hypothetical protein
MLSDRGRNGVWRKGEMSRRIIIIKYLMELFFVRVLRLSLSEAIKLYWFIIITTTKVKLLRSCIRYFTSEKFNLCRKVMKTRTLASEMLNLKPFMPLRIICSQLKKDQMSLIKILYKK